jgi:hypothetical protein
MMIINDQTFMAACIYNQDKIPQKFKEDTDYYHLKYTKAKGEVVGCCVTDNDPDFKCMKCETTW